MDLYVEVMESVHKITPTRERIDEVVLYINREFWGDVLYDYKASIGASEPRDPTVFGFKFFVMPPEHKRVNAAFY